MRTSLLLLVVAVLLAAASWLMFHPDDLGRAARVAEAQGRAAARQAHAALPDLDVEAIQAELKRTGRVVRRKAVAASRELAEATSDARATAAIKAKLALDPRLSALDISVDTTDGRVTLAGRVDSPEDIARAIRLALEPDQVREVVSTIQVRRR